MSRTRKTARLCNVANHTQIENIMRHVRPFPTIAGVGILIVLFFMLTGKQVGHSLQRNLLSVRWLQNLPLNEMQPQFLYPEALSDEAQLFFSAISIDFAGMCDELDVSTNMMCIRSRMASVYASDIRAVLSLQLEEFEESRISSTILMTLVADAAYFNDHESEALSLWQDYLPESAKVYKSNTLIDRNDYELAIALASTIQDPVSSTQIRRRLIHVLSTLAMYSFDRGDFEQSENLWRLALLQTSEHDTVYVGLGRTLVAQGRNQEAVSAYQQATELAPEKPQHYVRLGRVLFETEKPEDAYIAIQNALARNPNHEGALFMLNKIEKYLQSQ